MNKQGQGSYPQGDFWDVQDRSYAGQQLPPDHAFSELVEVKYKESSGKTIALALIGVLLFLVCGYAAYEYFVNENDPVDAVMAYFTGGGEEADPAASNAANQAGRKTKKRAAPVEPPAPVVTSRPEEETPANPYWELPNRILGGAGAEGRVWSTEEEDAFRAGLNNQFTYQQYKAVQDVRQLRLSGSDAILWEALQNKKFWTRMFAAVGLAEFNNEIPLETFEDLIRNARSELIADFLERFQRKPNAGQAYIARQMVKILDEKGRLSALKVINRSNDKLRDVYLTAATVDPGRSVQRWVRRTLGRRPLNPDKYNELMELVRGKGNTAALLGGEKPAAKPEAVETMSTGGDEDEFTGEIEFFEEDMTNMEAGTPAE
jgi:hypothetical protein